MLNNLLSVFCCNLFNPLLLVGAREGNRRAADDGRILRQSVESGPEGNYRIFEAAHAIILTNLGRSASRWPIR